MSESGLYVELITPDQARACLTNRVFPWMKERLDQGVCLAAKFTELEDARSLQQNAFMWVLLKEISEQAKVNGIGATPDGWHYYWKKRVLGYKFTKVKVPGSKRPIVRRELRSTRSLSVKKMSDYLEELIALAVTDFDVNFSERRWENHHG